MESFNVAQGFAAVRALCVLVPDGDVLVDCRLVDGFSSSVPWRQTLIQN